ncbi:MAG: DUF1592 domain-containing protein [Aureliella sp.]
MVSQIAAADFSPSEFLTRYCIDCHSGPDAEARVDLQLLADNSEASRLPLESDYETWTSVVQLGTSGIMPPADSELPPEGEKLALRHWFDHQLSQVAGKPGPHLVRRLAKHEYRNSLRSVFGFELEVNIMEAEQTITEKSLVLKLLPTDPPGRSGFTNDTNSNPLSDVAWEQYMYFADSFTREIFEPHRSKELSDLCESAVRTSSLNENEAATLLANFLARARRRELSQAEQSRATAAVKGLHGDGLIQRLRLEMQAELLSPRFLYRGTLQETTGSLARFNTTSSYPRVDEFELAERLSYFLWADMPDDELLDLAASKELSVQIDKQVVRMLRSPRSRSLAEDFAEQWLGLDQINLQISNNPPQLEALRSQPLDFLNYLFFEDRPILELLDSNVTFVNPHTAKYYGGPINRQMPEYRKQKGIEVEIVPNSQARLSAEFQRGGILTMPGILAMNRTPIQRGTWVLERILGEPLPEPPPDVPPLVPASATSESLTFRERFEQHREQATCAVCHDKIDPLGFAFEQFDAKGKLRQQSPQNGSGIGPQKSLDTGGTLLSGEAFSGAQDLKRILTTSESGAVIKNIVEKTLSYALCRRLTVHDVPTVNRIAGEMQKPDATWHDLFIAIAMSSPFQRYAPPTPGPQAESSPADAT